MFMGSYDFEGDTGALLDAYDRLMAGMPSEGLSFHACVAINDGIRIYDCCPSQDIFVAFSSSEQMRDAFRAAGLPEPTVGHIGDVHVGRIHDTFAG